MITADKLFQPTKPESNNIQTVVPDANFIGGGASGRASFGPSNGTEILVYPEKLKNSDFKFKKITLTLLDPNKIYENVANYIGEKVQSLVGSVSDIAKGGGGGNSLEAAGQKVKDDQLSLEEIIKNSNPICQIVLPLVNAFTEDNKHNYDEDTGFFGKLAGVLNETSSTVSSGIAEAYGRFGDATGNTSTMAFAPQLPQADPLKWQNFKGSALRSFSFVFKVIPRSSTEANSIMRIAYTLKKWSYPRKAGFGLALIPPARVLVEFGNPMLQTTVNPGICVIEGVTVTYEGANGISTTLDGVPRKMDIALTLKEFRQKYKDDWDFTV